MSHIFVSPFPDGTAWAVSKRPVNLLGQFRFGVSVSTSSDSSQDHGQDSKVLRHAGHCDTVLESIQVLASHSLTTQPTSSDTFTGLPTVPVLSSPSTSSVSPGHETILPSSLDVTQQALRNNTFTEPVVEMASASIRDSSSHLYNTHWKLFTDWLASKDIPTQSASYHQLADYLVHMFNQNKQVNTIKVHRSSVTSALRLLNPPNQLQNNTITNLLRDGYSET